MLILDPSAVDTLVLDSTSADWLVLVDNDVPSISDIPNQTTPENSAVFVQFVAADTETATYSLTVTATSSNQTLIPDANITVNPFVVDPPNTHSLTITPASGQFGTAVITVTVQDAGGLTAVDGFVVTVRQLVRTYTPLHCARGNRASRFGLVSYRTAVRGAKSNKATVRGTS